MPVERFFTPDALVENRTIQLKDSEFHHLAHVIRSRVGDHVEIINGQGVLAQSVIKEIKRDQALLQIEHVVEEPLKAPKLILAQAIPKPNRLEYVFEKGTELGVDEFWIFPGELSVKKEFFPKQMERMQAILISAIKQCGRLWLPKIVLYPELEQWDSITNQAFFGDLSEGAPLLIHELKNHYDDRARDDNGARDPVVFVTGPESGFTEEEQDLLRRLGAKGVKLHANVLRTDTASIAALSIISHVSFNQ